MPAPSKAPPPPATDSQYPAIESFIEKATADDIAKLLQPIKSSLTALKGPQAVNQKKAEKAVERTEELLTYLLQVREKIEKERKTKR
jgi:hypothetical protein